MKEYITGLQHVGIPTNNIDETTVFYKELGFEVAFQTVNEQTDEKVVFLRLGNVTIETYENKQAVLKAGAVDHVALNVTDIEAVYKAVEERGYCILDNGVSFLPFWEKGVRFFTILGPNKEKVEFSQYL